jgi:hypothetical protein
MKDFYLTYLNFVIFIESLHLIKTVIEVFKHKIKLLTKVFFEVVMLFLRIQIVLRKIFCLITLKFQISNLFLLLLESL